MSKMKSLVALKLSEWNRESSFYIEVMVIAIAARFEYKVEKIEKTEQFGSWNEKFFYENLILSAINVFALNCSLLNVACLYIACMSLVLTPHHFKRYGMYVSVDVAVISMIILPILANSPKNATKQMHYIVIWFFDGFFFISIG